MREGIGTCRWADKSEYTGNWQNNLQHYGIYKWMPDKTQGNSWT